MARRGRWIGPASACFVAAVFLLGAGSVLTAGQPEPGVSKTAPPGLAPSSTTSQDFEWQQLHTGTAGGFSGCEAAAYDDALRSPICVDQTGPGHFTSVWKFVGGEWTNITPHGPGPRGPALGPLVTDGQNELVLYPVLASNGSVETWGLSPYRWIDLAINGTPPNWTDPAMAYAPEDGVTLLFGGLSGSCSGPGGCQPENTTWHLFGYNWTNVTHNDTHAPTPRELAGLVADPLQRHVVLFGGGPDSDVGTNDAWSYYNGLWRTLTFSNGSVPPARTSECIGFDDPLESVVMANGLDAGHELADTWLLNGSGWTPVTGFGTLAGICSPYTTVYDVRDGYLLTLVSALNATSGPANETWILAPPLPSHSSGGIPWATVAIVGAPLVAAAVFVAVIYHHHRRGLRPRGPPPA